MIAYLLAAALSCDPALATLFTPAQPGVGRYEVCTTTDPLEEVAAATAARRPHYGPIELIEALDAFGSAGSYSRAALARLYGGKRVRVVRGWAQDGERFESITLLSPYPDAALTRLFPGTMMIKWSTSQ